MHYGKAVNYATCPECNKVIVELITVKIDDVDVYNEASQYDLDSDAYDNPIIKERILIYPKDQKFGDASSIPENYFKDYIEACNVLKISPKSSAALSRRLLQKILREEYKIQKKNLISEIEEFVSKENLPLYIEPVPIA